MVYGGVALMHRLAEDVGLVKAGNNHVPLLKVWLPYSEADHVLNFALGGLCEGTCLEDIELRRKDEAFLDALLAETIPDPTTAGDFCRRRGGMGGLSALARMPWSKGRQAAHATRKSLQMRMSPAREPLQPANPTDPKVPHSQPDHSPLRPRSPLEVRRRKTGSRPIRVRLFED